MSVSLAGGGAVLKAPAALITVLNIAVGAYLVLQGIRLLRRLRPSPEIRPASHRRDGGGAMFRNAYVVTALNPKSVMLIAALTPQFVVVEQPRLPQFALLMATFLVLAAANTALWALLADEVRLRMLGPMTVPLANGIGGGILIAAGLLTLAARQV